MKKYHGIIAELFSGRSSNRRRLAEILSAVALKAHADSTEDGGDDDSDDEGGGTPSVNYEDLITKARKEEKDKQYKKIEKLQEKIKVLEEQHNDDLVAKAALSKEIEKLKAQIDNADEGETVKTLRSENDSLKKENEELYGWEVRARKNRRTGERVTLTRG